MFVFDGLGAVVCAVDVRLIGGIWIWGWMCCGGGDSAWVWW